MSLFEEWASSRSSASHFAHMFFAPATIVNPFFYKGLYDSTQDGSTAGYVGEHLLYLSPWLPAAVYAGQSPFHIWTSGLSVMRYVALDYGAGAFLSNPVVLATAGAALGTVYVGSKLMAPDSPEKHSQPWYHFMQDIGENIRISAR